MSDSSLLLGTAIVEIAPDLTKLFAGFEEAKAARDAFDRAMVSGSDGLLKFNTVTKDTGGALADQATKTKATTDSTRDATAQIDKLTKAQKESADASKAASSALETEAQKTERLSQMVARSIDEMNKRDRLVPASGRSLASGGRDLELEAAQAAQMGLAGGGTAAGGKIAAGVLDGTATAAGATVAAKAIKVEAEAIEELGHKTKISSSAIREIIVLMREAGRGDFGRMAGSASLLAQQLGLVEKAGGPLLGTLGLITAAVGVVGYAMISADADANKFQNQLMLTGNAAGLTADRLQDSAARVSNATNTSVAANERLIKSLAASNDFTRAQMESLATAAEKLSKATGDSTDDIIKDFGKMAEGPTKYAEAFQHAHVGIITPVQMEHIRQLEARGEKEQALAELIAAVTDGITKNTVDNINIMQRAWDGFINAVSNGWHNLQAMFKDSTLEESIAEKTERINNLIRQQNNPGPGSRIANYFNPALAQARDAEIKQLMQERSALQENLNTQNKAADAQGRAAIATRAQTDANTRLNGSYRGLIDNQTRFTNDTVALKQTLIDAAGLHGTLDAATISVGALQAAIAKKAPGGIVEEMGQKLPEAIEKLRKQDLPAAFAADAKAMRAAEAAARKLENAAEALEKRRQQAIQLLTEEAATLGLVVPLYQDQAADLETVNRAKAITIALSRLKLSADSAEGQSIATLTGKIFDLNKAIDDETKKRSMLAEMREQTANLQTETRFLGEYGEEVNALRIYQEKVNQAIRDRIKLTPQFLQSLAQEARAQARAQKGLDDKTLRRDYAGDPNKPVSADEIHGLDQTLGGKFKRNDDLKLLEQKIAREKKVLEAARKAGLKSEADYQKALLAIDRQALEEKTAILNAERDMKIDSAIGIAQSLESIAADAFGKQSVAYKIAFDVEKAFTIAKAALAMQQDISQAAAKGFPQNIPLIAMAVAEGATIISNIRSIALSFADGGLVRGPGSGTSDSIQANLSDGEFVVNAQSTAKYRAEIEAINAGRPIQGVGRPVANDRGPSITINNMHSGVDHDVSYGVSMNDVVITARRVLHEEGPGVIGRDMQRQNSPTSKALTRSKNVVARRS